jgi:hypothetical protein
MDAAESHPDSQITTTIDLWKTNTRRISSFSILPIISLVDISSSEQIFALSHEKTLSHGPATWQRPVPFNPSRSIAILVQKMFTRRMFGLPRGWMLSPERWFQKSK